MSSQNQGSGSRMLQALRRPGSALLTRIVRVARRSYHMFGSEKRRYYVKGRKVEAWGSEIDLYPHQRKDLLFYGSPSTSVPDLRARSASCQELASVGMAGGGMEVRKAESVDELLGTSRLSDIHGVSECGLSMDGDSVLGSVSCYGGDDEARSQSSLDSSGNFGSVDRDLDVLPDRSLGVVYENEGGERRRGERDRGGRTSPRARERGRLSPVMAEVRVVGSQEPLSVLTSDWPHGESVSDAGYDTLSSVSSYREGVSISSISGYSGIGSPSPLLSPTPQSPRSHWSSPHHSDVFCSTPSSESFRRRHALSPNLDVDSFPPTPNWATHPRYPTPPNAGTDSAPPEPNYSTHPLYSQGFKSDEDLRGRQEDCTDAGSSSYFGGTGAKSCKQSSKSGSVKAAGQGGHGEEGRWEGWGGVASPEGKEGPRPFGDVNGRFRPIVLSPNDRNVTSSDSGHPHPTPSARRQLFPGEEAREEEEGGEEDAADVDESVCQFAHSDAPRLRVAGTDSGSAAAEQTTGRGNWSPHPGKLSSRATEPGATISSLPSSTTSAFGRQRSITGSSSSNNSSCCRAEVAMEEKGLEPKQTNRPISPVSSLATPNWNRKAWQQPLPGNADNYFGSIATALTTTPTTAERVFGVASLAFTTCATNTTTTTSSSSSPSSAAAVTSTTSAAHTTASQGGSVYPTQQPKHHQKLQGAGGEGALQTGGKISETASFSLKASGSASLERLKSEPSRRESSQEALSSVLVSSQRQKEAGQVDSAPTPLSPGSPFSQVEASSTSLSRDTLGKYGGSPQNLSTAPSATASFEEDPSLSDFSPRSEMADHPGEFSRGGGAGWVDRGERHLVERTDAHRVRRLSGSELLTRTCYVRRYEVQVHRHELKHRQVEGRTGVMDVDSDRDIMVTVETLERSDGTKSKTYHANMLQDTQISPRRGKGRNSSQQIPDSCSVSVVSSSHTLSNAELVNSRLQQQSPRQKALPDSLARSLIDDTTGSALTVEEHRGSNSSASPRSPRLEYHAQASAQSDPTNHDSRLGPRLEDSLRTSTDSSVYGDIGTLTDSAYGTADSATFSFVLRSQGHLTSELDLPAQDSAVSQSEDSATAARRKLDSLIASLGADPASEQSCEDFPEFSFLGAVASPQRSPSPFSQKHSHSLCVAELSGSKGMREGATGGSPKTDLDALLLSLERLARENPEDSDGGDSGLGRSRRSETSSTFHTTLASADLSFSESESDRAEENLGRCMESDHSVRMLRLSTLDDPFSTPTPTHSHPLSPGRPLVVTRSLTPTRPLTPTQTLTPTRPLTPSSLDPASPFMVTRIPVQHLKQFEGLEDAASVHSDTSRSSTPVEITSLSTTTNTATSTLRLTLSETSRLSPLPSEKQRTTGSKVHLDAFEFCRLRAGPHDSVRGSVEVEGQDGTGSQLRRVYLAAVVEDVERRQNHTCPGNCDPRLDAFRIRRLLARGFSWDLRLLWVARPRTHLPALLEGEGPEGVEEPLTLPPSSKAASLSAASWTESVCMAAPLGLLRLRLCEGKDELLKDLLPWEEKKSLHEGSSPCLCLAEAERLQYTHVPFRSH